MAIFNSNTFTAFLPRPIILMTYSMTINIVTITIITKYEEVLAGYHIFLAFYKLALIVEKYTKSNILVVSY